MNNSLTLGQALAVTYAFVGVTSVCLTVNSLHDLAPVMLLVVIYPAVSGWFVTCKIRQRRWVMATLGFAACATTVWVFISAFKGERFLGVLIFMYTFFAGVFINLSFSRNRTPPPKAD